MNWILFDKLRAHIARLEPGRFNYWRDPVEAGDECGCVAYHCRVITGYQKDGWDVLVDELGVTEPEARTLYGGNGFGAKGIAEALYRLDFIASRYTRPAISVNPETILGVRPRLSMDDRERAFLLQCMETASQPISEQVE